jgi:hypothetical protein
MLALVPAFLVSTPCQGLALTPGTTWTYRAEVAWEAGAADSIARQSLPWTTTIITARTSDSAVAALVSGWPTDLAWWTPGRLPSTSVLYCTGGRIYLFHPQPGTEPQFIDALLNGQQTPALENLILSLPLHTGGLYARDPAERQDAFYAWYVETAELAPDSLRRLQPGKADSLYSIVYRTAPDYTLIGFLPGLGVVHYVYNHHGTTAESEAWLVAYRRSQE